MWGFSAILFKAQMRASTYCGWNREGGHESGPQKKGSPGSQNESIRISWSLELLPTCNPDHDRCGINYCSKKWMRPRHQIHRNWFIAPKNHPFEALAIRKSHSLRWNILNRVSQLSGSFMNEQADKVPNHRFPPRKECNQMNPWVLKSDRLSNKGEPGSF